MKVHFKPVAVGILVFNVGLVALTVGLSIQSELQSPMTGALIDVDGVSIHAVELLNLREDTSAAPEYDAVVLMHGASTSLLDFADNLMPVLSIDYPVVALDRPGHGYSERGAEPEMDDPAKQASLIFNTLEKMGIRRPVLVGHSWAGSVVLAALMEGHDSVKPVAGILIAGVTHPYTREDSAPTRMALAPYFGPIFRWQYLSPIGRLAIAPTVEKFFAPDTVPENYARQTGLNLTLRPKPYLHNARDRSNLSGHLVEQSEGYTQINVPLLSIFTSEDPIVPHADHHDKLVETLPTTQSVEIVGAGHLPHHTRTDEVVKAIDVFIQQLE